MQTPHSASQQTNSLPHGIKYCSILTNSSPHFTALTWNYSTALQHVLEVNWCGPKDWREMLVSAFHHLLQTFMNAHEPSSPSRKSVQTLLPLPVPLFSLCLCYMPHCLLFYSRWMLPPQLFVCFCSFYLCDSLQILWTLVFVILPFPYKTLLLLMFCSYLLPIIPHLSPRIYLCAVPFCVSLLSSVQWKIQRFSSYW